MIAALGKALGEPRTKGDWGKYAAAAADLCRAGAEPDRVGWLVDRWGELYPGATCTPTALSNNYASLVSERKPMPKNGKGPRLAPPSWDSLKAEADRRGVVIGTGRPALEAG